MEILVLALRARRRGHRRDPGRGPGPARPGHRADRHGAAGEVQLGHLGPSGQGRTGDGQYHGCDGLPGHDPTVVALVLAPAAWQATEGSYTAFASAGIAFASSAFIFIPMARRGRLRGRNLLVGGIFYVAYLLMVITVITNAFG